MKELYVSSEIRNTDMALVTYFSKSDLCHSCQGSLLKLKKLMGFPWQNFEGNNHYDTNASSPEWGVLEIVR